MNSDQSNPGYLKAEWPAPAGVHALVTLRTGGYSTGAYAGFNLAMHTGDDPDTVRRNRELLQTYFQLPAEPVWLQQVHGNRLVEADPRAREAAADGSWSRTPGQVCAVMTADCLPVLVCNRDGTMVAAAHAGWRGLQAGIVTRTVRQLQADAADLMVWLGPAIGPQVFEVGADVVRAFSGTHQDNVKAFRQIDEHHWLCDMYALARIELANLGVASVFGGDYCTYSDEQRFYSYRRDNITGRMASLIWLE